MAGELDETVDDLWQIVAGMFLYERADDQAENYLRRTFMQKAEAVLRKAAAPALPVPEGWRDIETYPRDRDEGSGCDWGPSVVLRVPCGTATHSGFAEYVGHLEADEWLIRDMQDPVSWCPPFAAPTHWMPLPASPPAPVSEK